MMNQKENQFCKTSICRLRKFFVVKDRDDVSLAETATTYPYVSVYIQYFFSGTGMALQVSWAASRAPRWRRRRCARRCRRCGRSNWSVASRRCSPSQPTAASTWRATAPAAGSASAAPSPFRRPPSSSHCSMSSSKRSVSIVKQRNHWT